MKTFFIVLVTFIITFCVHAETRTCSNHPIGGAQYSSFDQVYMDSSSGDTILLEKSNIPYEFVTVNGWFKGLTVIGIGINPNITDASRSMIGNIGGIVDGGSSGSQFHGITFTDALSFSDLADNITIENCSFEPGAYLNFNDAGEYSNYLIINSVFKGINEENVKFTSSVTGSWHFLNCIFSGYINGNGVSSFELIFDHCLFMNNVLLGSHFQNLHFATISNCIFVNQVLFPSAGNTDCVYNNNMASFTEPPIVGSGNTGSGNITGGILYTNRPSGEAYSPDHDYDLLPGSIGLNAATDGTDIGIHGGNTNFDEALEPSIVPIVTATTIENGGSQVNGIITVHVQARKSLTE